MKNSNKIPCIRCLMREMDEEEEYKKLKEYLDTFSEEIRADENTYEERLQKCKGCDSLNQGICGKCGCFVEARALRKKGYCPHEEPRW